MHCTKIRGKPQNAKQFNAKGHTQGNAKTKKTTQTATEQKACHKCGKSPPHPAVQCPTRNAECHNCGKRGHYGKVCRLASTVNELAEDTDGLFLGEVSSGEKPWMAEIGLKGSKMTFKIDTGTDVTAIPEQVYISVMQGDKEIKGALKQLYGPGGAKLNVLGSVTETLTYKERSITEKIYIVKNLDVGRLLSRPASVRLKLVARVDMIDQETVRTTYPKLCDGLGLVQKPYTIKFKPDAKPFSLKVPRQVPLPFMGKVKRKLERMESLGVISCIEAPTEWCCGMVAD